jgi:hypothetical protein
MPKFFNASVAQFLRHVRRGITFTLTALLIGACSAPLGVLHGSCAPVYGEPQGVAQLSPFEGAQRQCEWLAGEAGYQLHETPEWHSGSGLTCVLDAMQHDEECSDVGGHHKQLAEGRYCMVELAYARM